MHNPLRAGQPNAYHCQSCSLQLVRGCSNSVWAPLFYFTPHLNVCRGTQTLADFPFLLLGAQGHRFGVCGVATRFAALCPPDTCPPFIWVPRMARRAPTLGSPRAVQDRISHPSRMLLSKITSKQILLWDEVHQIKTRGRAGPTGEDSSLGRARFCSMLSGVSFGFVTEAMRLLPLVFHQKKSKNYKKRSSPLPTSPAGRGSPGPVVPPGGKLQARTRASTQGCGEKRENLARPEAAPAQIPPQAPGGRVPALSSPTRKGKGEFTLGESPKPVSVWAGWRPRCLHAIRDRPRRTATPRGASLPPDRAYWGTSGYWVYWKVDTGCWIYRRGGKRLPSW